MNPRSISNVALDIKMYWPKPYFGAVPYLEAMMDLDTIDEMYGADSARSIVMYFLSNAQTFHGPEARRLKNELKEILGIKPVPNGQKRKRDDGVLLTIKVPGGTIEIG